VEPARPNGCGHYRKALKIKMFRVRKRLKAKTLKPKMLKRHAPNE
jgi:hypothetical protein